MYHSQKIHRVTEFCYDWYFQYTIDLHYIVKQKNTTIYESKNVPKVCLEGVTQRNCSQVITKRYDKVIKRHVNILRKLKHIAQGPDHRGTKGG